MYARVKKGSKFHTVTSCGGKEFSIKEFRPVPAGCEVEAESNPLLDVIDDEDVLPEIETQAIPSEDDPVEPETVDATNSAIALAIEYGVDISSEVEGSGSGGRILKSDVQNLFEEEES